ncbi:hypothetical protein [Oceanibaculum pacificum]|nr:hypothetical protein [Oceanibaculum pacificum]
MSEQSLTMLDRTLSSIALIGSFTLLMTIMTYGWVTAFRVMAS